MTRRAREAGARTVVDASTDALLAALPAGPDLVKPNHHELAEVSGETDPVAGARRLLGQGAREVVVSAGAEGLVDVRADGEVWRAALDAPLSGNPTGAGDAAVAALAAALAEGRPVREALADAVAWSAAAVLHPLAGQVRPEDVSRLLPRVHVEQQRSSETTPPGTEASPPTAPHQEEHRAHPAP